MRHILLIGMGAVGRHVARALQNEANRVRLSILVRSQYVKEVKARVDEVVPGEVQGRDAAARGGELLVSTALGPLRAIAAGAISGRCVLAVRPENVAVGAAPAGEGNRVAGRISLISYLGNTLRYDVETEPGLVLRADIRDPWHHDPLPIGRPVTLSFPPSVTLAVSDDA